MKNKAKINYIDINKEALADMSPDILKKILLYAKVDPNFLKTISPILGRAVEHEMIKDNEDYNKSVISKTVDRGIRVLMEGGLISTYPLDLLKVVNDHLRYLGDSESRLIEMAEAIKNKDYSKYPYDHSIEADIRSYFILQTSSKDTFESLMKELDENIHKVMDLKEWQWVKKCIYDGHKRISSESIMFPDPIEGYEQGEKITPSKIDQELMGFQYDPEFSFDKRQDGHDLLALKELVEIVKGKPVHPLSIGPGFLLKYIPEITRTDTNDDPEKIWFFDKTLFPNEVGFDDNDDEFFNKNSEQENDVRIAKAFDKESFYKSLVYDGVFFEVNKSTNLLKKIKLFQVVEGREYFTTGIMIAALGLHYSNVFPGWARAWGVKRRVMDNQLGLHAYYRSDNPKTGEESYFITKEQANDVSHFDNSNFFVLVPSQVAGPSNQYPYEYQDISTNNKVIKCAECYLFEKQDNEVLNTRLYFYPYRPKEVHPMLQHGSAIFGANDQSYHPCKLVLKDADRIDSATGETKMSPYSLNYLKDVWREDLSDFSNSPLITAAIMTDMKNLDGSYVKDHTDVLKKKNYNVLANIYSSTYEFNKRILLEQEILFLNKPFVFSWYSSDQVFKTIRDVYTKNFLPFHKRFAIWKYADDYQGINREEMDTFINKLAGQLADKTTENQLLIMSYTSEMKRLMEEEGKNYEEARKLVYTPEQIQEQDEKYKKMGL